MATPGANGSTNEAATHHPADRECAGAEECEAAGPGYGGGCRDRNGIVVEAEIGGGRVLIGKENFDGVVSGAVDDQA